MEKNQERRQTELVRLKRERRAEKKREKLELQGQRQWLNQQKPIAGLHEAIDEKGRTIKAFVPEKHIVRIKIPETFSFIEDPVGALTLIEHLKAQLSKTFIRQVHLDHSGCTNLGLCAQAFMDVLLMEKRNSFYISGSHSNNMDANIMLRATGTLRQLKHPDMNLPSEIEKRIRRSELFRSKSRKQRATWNEQVRDKVRDQAGTRLVNYFNECLKTQKHSLTPRGMKYLSDLITEVIGNCEEHGGGRWYTIGYFRQPTEGDKGDCHIVLFNFGKTIYESLNANSSSSRIKQQIEDMVKKHQRRGFFGGKKWLPETLWTLYALQDGISRYRYTPAGRTRGTGSIQMIQAFLALAGEFKKMCIVSGKAYILFDGKHELRDKQVTPTETRKVIAFNDANDLEIPPDSEYVYCLPVAFPGTLVSMHFSLEEAHLRRFTEQPHV